MADGKPFVTADMLSSMTPAEIRAATNDGRMAYLLRGEEPLTPGESTTPGQLGRHDLRRMSPSEIRDALMDGRLDDYLAGRHAA